MYVNVCGAVDSFTSHVLPPMSRVGGIYIHHMISSVQPRVGPTQFCGITQHRVFAITVHHIIYHSRSTACVGGLPHPKL